MVSVTERKLTIKRVATVVSNYQENASAEDLKSLTKGCGRNCLGNCCLPGTCSRCLYMLLRCYLFEISECCKLYLLYLGETM